MRPNRFFSMSSFFYLLDVYVFNSCHLDESSVSSHSVYMAFPSVPVCSILFVYTSLNSLRRQTESDADLYIPCVCVLFDFTVLYPAKELPVIYSSA